MKKEDSEKTSLSIYSWPNLWSEKFAPGDIYWEKSSGQKTLVLRAGEPVCGPYLEKLSEKNILLKIDNYQNEEVISGIVSCFHRLQESTLESDRFIIRNEIIEILKRNYWDDCKNSSLLTLVLAGVKSFYHFNKEQEEELQETSIMLYKRSAFMSIFLVILALVHGYLDFKFLSDLYHLGYMFDAGYKHEVISYNLLMASKSEWQTARGGEAYLKSNPGFLKEEIVFLNHPSSGVDEALVFCSDLIKNKELLNLVLKHHERMNGQGMPHGFSSLEMTDLEALVVLVNHIAPYDNLFFKKNDGDQYFKRIFKTMSSELVSKGILGLRQQKIVENVFTNIGDNLQVKKEVA